jgi:hypothetical protein
MVGEHFILNRPPLHPRLVIILSRQVDLVSIVSHDKIMIVANTVQVYLLGHCF